MHKLLLIAFLFVVNSVSAQTFLPGSFINSNYRGNVTKLNINDSSLSKKWSISRYSGISTSFTAWKGGSASIISAPIGLQLNRRINNNVFAFAGVFAAPAYINLTRSFVNSDFNKVSQNSFFYKGGNLKLYSRAELGLSYINDERTFQISGSIGIERNNFPGQFYYPGNNNNASYNSSLFK